MPIPAGILTNKRARWRGSKRKHLQCWTQAVLWNILRGSRCRSRKSAKSKTVSLTTRQMIHWILTCKMMMTAPSGRPPSTPSRSLRLRMKKAPSHIFRCWRSLKTSNKSQLISSRHLISATRLKNTQGTRLSPRPTRRLKHRNPYNFPRIKRCRPVPAQRMARPSSSLTQPVSRQKNLRLRTY